MPPGAWWLQFGPDHGALDCVIGALHLQAVQPQQLACVQLWHQGQVVYQLDSQADARGSPLPAGDLLHAMARLADGDAQVTEVGLAVGFTSNAAFSRAFTAFVGEAPSVWRRRHAPSPAR